MSIKSDWDIDNQRKRWAEQHDWFVRAVRTPSTGTWRIVGNMVEIDPVTKESFDDYQSFENFQELRNWAGY